MDDSKSFPLRRRPGRPSGRTRTKISVSLQNTTLTSVHEELLRIGSDNKSELIDTLIREALEARP